MPSRCATCQIVSPGLALTTFPSRVKSNWSVILIILTRSPARVAITKPLGTPCDVSTRRLVQEELHSRDESVGCGLTKPADRSLAHGLSKLLEQRLVPYVVLEKRHGLVAAHTAGRALTTRFIFEEA